MPKGERSSKIINGVKMSPFLKKKPKESPQFSEIGTKTNFEGELFSKVDVILKGKVKGKIESGAKFVTESNGFIEGEISSKISIISGNLTGNLKSEEVILESGSSLEGSINYKKLVVKKRAFIYGKLKNDILRNQ